MDTEKKSLSISTVPVTIRVVEVGGKRMSLSVFKQIQPEYFFSEEIDGLTKYLGWVDYGGNKHILFSIGGNLFKDTFIPEAITPQVREGYSTSIKNLSYANKRGYEPLIIECQKSYEDRKAKFDKEEAFCKSCNDPYFNLMTPETQVFISI